VGSAGLKWRTARASASAPRTGLNTPASDSSPANSKPSRRCGSIAPRCRQGAQRDRQVEAARLLGQVGRRELDGDALVVGKRNAALQQRGAYPFAGFIDFGIGQAHRREAGQAVGQMHLDGHRLGLQGIECAAVDDGEGHGFASCQCRAGVRCDLEHQLDALWLESAPPWGEHSAAGSKPVLVHRIGAMAWFLHIAVRISISVPTKPSLEPIK